jgi:hypothetical protein
MKFRKWAMVAALSVVLIAGGGSAFVRLGTTVIGDFVSPDGMHDAVLTVRNGGAMTGFATGVSLVRRNPISRQLALIEHMNLFVIDDNDGAVAVGDRGQLDVQISWVSNTQLLIKYPAKARIFTQEASYQSTAVRYAPSQ